jgi:hypothetical protein
VNVDGRTLLAVDDDVQTFALAITDDCGPSPPSLENVTVSANTRSNVNVLPSTATYDELRRPPRDARAGDDRISNCITGIELARAIDDEPCTAAICRVRHRWVPRRACEPHRRGACNVVDNDALTATHALDVRE